MKTYCNTKKQSKLSIALWIILLLSLIPFLTAKAIDTRWTGAVNTDWNNAGNWDYGVPGIYDNAIFSGITVSVSSIDDLFNNLIVTDNANVTIADSLTLMGSVSVYSGNLNIGDQVVYAGGSVSGSGSISANSAKFTIGGDVSISSLTISGFGEIYIAGNWSIPNGSYDSDNATITFNGVGSQTVSTSADYSMYYWNEVIIDKPSGTIVFSYPFDTQSFTVNSGYCEINQLFTAYIDHFILTGGSTTLGEGNFQFYVQFELNGGTLNNNSAYVQLNFIDAILNGTTWSLGTSITEFNSSSLHIDAGSIIQGNGHWLFNGNSVNREIESHVDFNLPSVQFNKSADGLNFTSLSGTITANLYGTLDFYNYLATGERGVLYAPLSLNSVNLIYQSGSALSYSRSSGIPITGPEWPNGLVPKVKLIQGIVTLSATKTAVDTLVRVNGKIIGSLEYAAENSCLEYSPSILTNVIIDTEWPDSYGPESVSINLPGYSLIGYCSKSVSKNFSLLNGSLNLNNHSLTVRGIAEGSTISGSGSFPTGTNVTIGTSSASSKIQTLSGNLQFSNLTIDKFGAETDEDNTVILTNGFTLLANATLQIDNGFLDLNGFPITTLGNNSLVVNATIQTGGSNLLDFANYDVSSGIVKYDGQLFDEHILADLTLKGMIVSNPHGIVPEPGVLYITDFIDFEIGKLVPYLGGDVRLGPNAVVTNAGLATGWIVGSLQREFASPDTFSFPIGTFTRYRPATFGYSMEVQSLSSIVDIEYSTTSFITGSAPTGITEIRETEHYILSELGTTPDSLSYTFTGIFEDQNFIPEDRNRILIQLSETPTWSIAQIDSEDDINTETNSITISNCTAFPLFNGILAFGKGDATVFFTASQDFDWFNAANWSTGTLPTSVDQIAVQNGSVIFLGDNDGNSETETPIQNVASLVLEDGAELIVEATNTASTALIIGDGFGEDTVLTVNPTAEFTIGGGQIKSVALASGNEKMRVRGKVNMNSGQGFGSGSGGLSLPTNRQIWEEGSTLNYNIAAAYFQIQSYGFLNLNPSTLLVLNDDLETKDDLFVTGGSVAIANGSVNGKRVKVDKNFRVKNGATLVMGQDASFDNELVVRGNFNREPSATIVQHNGTMLRLESDTDQELCANTSIMANLGLSGIGAKKINCDLVVTNELEIEDGIIETDTLTLTVGTSIENPGKISVKPKVLGKTAPNQITKNDKKGGVYGKVKIWIPASTVSNIVFPILYKKERRDVIITFTEASSGGNLTVSFNAKKPEQVGLPVTDEDGKVIKNLDPIGYWTVKTGAGLSGGKYSIDLYSSDYLGVTQPNNLRILKRPYSNKPWEVLGVHEDGEISPDGEIISKRRLLTGFSDFIIAGGDENSLPIELTSFLVDKNDIYPELKWNTATEKSNYGFYIQKSFISTAQLDTVWNEVEFVRGAGDSYESKSYSFIDKTVSEAGKYVYRLTQTDFDGIQTIYGPIEYISESPDITGFAGAYPNPFNPSTVLNFQISKAAKVNIELYDVLGRLVSKVLNQEMQAGNYQVPFTAQQLSSGMYFFVLRTDGRQFVHPVTLMK